MRRRLFGLAGVPVVLGVLAGCGGAGTSPPAAAPAVSPAPAQSAAPDPGAAGGPGALTFDDGSPGRLSASRAADGTTTTTVELDTTGAEVTRVTLSAANAAADVTGLDVPVTGSGGSWTGQVLLPLPGAWTFEVTVKRNDGGFITHDLANVKVPL